jgi:hypothetical protein
VHVGRLTIDLGRAAPHHAEAIAVVVAFEVLDVLHELLGQLHLVLALFDVRTGDLLDPGLLEYRRHGADRAEFFLDLGQERGLEDTCPGRSIKAILRKDIPASETEIIERRQRHVVANLWRVVVGALAQPDGSKLTQRADRLLQAAARGEDARDEGSCDRAKSGQ